MVNGKNFSNNDDLAAFFAVKDQKFCQHGDREVTRNMAKGHPTEWKIFD